MAFNPREHLMDLKGKEYLQVMWRLVWFREDKPGWCILTELVEREEGFALFRASIADEDGEVKATAFGSETVKDFRDYIEKAETKAVGRALAMLGYGTQFTATELDEGERIVDSPVAKPKAKPAAKAAQEAPKAKPEPEDLTYVCHDCEKVLTPEDTLKTKNGRHVDMKMHLDKVLGKWGVVLCADCATTRIRVDDLKREKVNKETA